MNQLYLLTKRHVFGAYGNFLDIINKYFFDQAVRRGGRLFRLLSTPLGGAIAPPLHNYIYIYIYNLFIYLKNQQTYNERSSD